MFEKEAEEWLDERYLKDMGVRKPCKEAYLAGLKTGIRKLRYCCICKKMERRNSMDNKKYVEIIRLCNADKL